jgi:hypothetical protein
VINKLLNPLSDKRTRPEVILEFEGLKKFRNHLILGKEIAIGLIICYYQIYNLKTYKNEMKIQIKRTICCSCGKNLINQTQHESGNKLKIKGIEIEEKMTAECPNKHSFCCKCFEQVLIFLLKKRLKCIIFSLLHIYNKRKSMKKLQMEISM